MIDHKFKLPTEAYAPDAELRAKWLKWSGRTDAFHPINVKALATYTGTGTKELV